MSAFFNEYGSLIVQMVLAALLALSLYLPLMAGQLSLASSGFYALGGYVAALLSTTTFKVTGAAAGTYPIGNILIEMVVAAAACGLLAVIIGVPALRLRGVYLALATIAFVEVLRVFALTQEFTGGAVGIYNIPEPFISPSRIDYLWLAGPLLLAAMFFVFRLERSRVGRALIAIREDELAAGAMGINTTYYKALAFVLGAVLAGLTGVIAAHLLRTWNARQGTFDVSINILAFALIGGSRTVFGPVVGAVVLTALPEVLRRLGNLPGLPEWLGEFLSDGRLVIYGLLIVACTIFFPQGLITPDLFRRRRRPEVADAVPAATAPQSAER
jgi:branched-chain amino acid transport system permease protein